MLIIFTFHGCIINDLPTLMIIIQEESKKFNNECKEAAEIAESKTSNDVHDWISADWKCKIYDSYEIVF